MLIAVTEGLALVQHTKLFMSCFLQPCLKLLAYTLLKATVLRGSGYMIAQDLPGGIAGAVRAQTIAPGFSHVCETWIS